jgi:hypothetical protein
LRENQREARALARHLFHRPPTKLLTAATQKGGSPFRCSRLRLVHC